MIYAVTYTPGNWSMEIDRFEYFDDAQDCIMDNVRDDLDNDREWTGLVDFYNYLLEFRPYEAETLFAPFEKTLDDLKELYMSYYQIEEVSEL